MHLERELGYNPFKMGLVDGADVHSGYQGNEEFNFHGGHGNVDDTPQKRLNPNMTPAGVRVLEIPTPRWNTYDSVRNNLPLTDIVPPTIQERAWSSPIWYTPAQKEDGKAG